MWVKKLVDTFFSALIVIVFLPILGIISVLIYFDVGTPIFFIQDRVGYAEKVFKMVKFRTMNNAVDPAGRLLSDAKRTTRLGAFLRNSSLDELPELWNILCGQMSFVGPRPLLVRYLPRYSVKQRRRHAVLPGLTGLAQVSGRNSISWSEKFDFDVWYVDNWSIVLDMKIFVQTFAVLINRSGVNHSESVPMPEFWGEVQSDGVSISD
jgi:lipopolysaccharide/colanic/teichoic acid biosynthesis glycosyltransferase